MEMEGGSHKIIHIDMDAFYAAVEQRDDPELRRKPVAVGGSRERGVVAAASYEARKFGVHSAMPSLIASRKCPDLIFVKPRFDVYQAISRQIRNIFAEYTPIIEPLSLPPRCEGRRTSIRLRNEISGRQWSAPGGVWFASWPTAPEGVIMTSQPPGIRGMSAQIASVDPARNGICRCLGRSKR